MSVAEQIGYSTSCQSLVIFHLALAVLYYLHNFDMQLLVS